MNNNSVQQLIDECLSDLTNAMAIVTSIGSSSNVVPYLNKYSVIRACGTIEVAFKAIITDYCVYRSKPQLKNYVSLKVKDSSMNPSYSNICGLLKSFDDSWCNQLKQQLEVHPDKSKILSALKSLVDSRNDFAHGGNPTISLNDSIGYYKEAVKLIDILDNIIR